MILSGKYFKDYIGFYSLLLSGPRSCTCSDQFACSSDEENTVDRIFGVLKEEDCQVICLNNSDCQIYTWSDNIEIKDSVYAVKLF